MSKLQVNASPKSSRFLVDGEPFGYGYCIDFLEIIRSGVSDGNYFFLTCSCGEPGCAGLYEPIEVTSDEKRIYWHVSKPEPERWYTFNKYEYLKALRHLFPELNSIKRVTAGRMGMDKYFFDTLLSLKTQFDARLAEQGAAVNP